MMKQTNCFISLNKFMNSQVSNHINLILNLRDDNIYLEEAQILSSKLLECVNLQVLTLNLSQNKIGYEVFSTVVQALQKCTQINELILDFSENKIDKQGAQIIGFILINYQNLQILNVDLNFNVINSEGVFHLISYLKQVKNLSSLVLKICGNNISELINYNLEYAFNGFQYLENLEINLGYVYMIKQQIKILTNI
ncbi:hypothetical protein ABPG72_016279 [Tetrahymena utriculariae]